MQTSSHPPIVCDLDGTLVCTDTLYESFIKLIKHKPLLLLALPLWLAQGRSQLKAKIAAQVSLDPGALPYRADLLSYLQQEKSAGRRIILATAADERIAQGVARHVGLFDEVWASTPENNLKGTRKLERIRQSLGDDFVYAGDSRADLPVWRAARAAILADVPPSLASQIGDKPIERSFEQRPAGLKDVLKAIRIHQWVKNLLIFVPTLTSFGFMQPGTMLTSAWAFLAFSLTASATYLVNDLWDLDNDRRHERKRHRPMASGRIQIPQALALAAGLLVLGLGLSLTVSKGFAALLLCYLVFTSAYSWHLKTFVLMDAVMLAVLYTLRIIAGAAAIHVALSNWLMAFSVFIFLSLALVKRCAELVSLEQSGKSAARGRDYQTGDLSTLWPLGVGAGMSSVVVLCLFINSPELNARYASPLLLWALPLTLVYWLGRIWIKTSRGEMHDDPIVYALRDRASRWLVAGMTLVVLLAHFIRLDF